MAPTDPANALDSNHVPERFYETEYTAVVFEKGSPVSSDAYPTESDRRNAVVGILLTTYEEVSAEAVAQILDPFGGANADEALRQVLRLYAEFGVDAHLGEHLRDVGPAALYTAFTDYGDGSTFVEHYASRQERLTELRQRAANLAEGYPVEFFDNADETTCKKVIEYALMPTNGRLHLFDAQRQDVGGTYTSYNSES